MKPDRILRCERDHGKAAPAGFCDCGTCYRKRRRDWEKLCAQTEPEALPEAVVRV